MIDSVTLAPLDEVLDQFLPALLGQGMAADSLQRQLLSLSRRFGGLAIPMVAKSAKAEHQASLAITAPIVNLTDAYPNESDRDAPAISPDQNSQSVLSIVEGMASPVLEAVGEARGIARQKRQGKVGGCRQQQTELAAELSPVQRQLLAVADEKGVSTWLKAQASWKNCTVLKKLDFRDALCIHYGLPLENVCDHCVCGKSMTTHHALTCPTGGYPSARHNELRDLLAGVLQEVRPDVEIEPSLLPLHGEDISATRSGAPLQHIAAGCADTGRGVTSPLHAGRPKAFVFNLTFQLSVLFISEFGLSFCFGSYSSGFHVIGVVNKTAVKP